MIFKRCIFANFWHFLVQNNATILHNLEHNIGFKEKRQFVRRKLSKIAENCDRNIDPWNPGST
jgi:hypothetical protein